MSVTLDSEKTLSTLVRQQRPHAGPTLARHTPAPGAFLGFITPLNSGSLLQVQQRSPDCPALPHPSPEFCFLTEWWCLTEPRGRAGCLWFCDLLPFLGTSGPGIRTFQGSWCCCWLQSETPQQARPEMSVQRVVPEFHRGWNRHQEFHRGLNRHHLQHSPTLHRKGSWQDLACPRRHWSGHR